MSSKRSLRLAKSPLLGTDSVPTWEHFSPNVGIMLLKLVLQLRKNSTKILKFFLIFTFLNHLLKIIMGYVSVVKSLQKISMLFVNIIVEIYITVMKLISHHLVSNGIFWIKRNQLFAEWENRISYTLIDSCLKEKQFFINSLLEM